MYKFLKKIGNTDYISEWKTKELFDEFIKPLTTYNNSLAPGLSYSGNETRVKFVGNCSKQDKVTFTHGTIVNI